MKPISKKYDIIADKYHETRNKKNFYNHYLEMPNTLKLIGKIKGKKILDFGCGTGIYSKILKDNGAKVKGFDISKKMIEIAKKENPNIEFKISKNNKIPYKEKFDIIIAPLVFHYIKDWNKTFDEIKRVLNKNGTLIFSISHPFFETIDKKKIKNKKLIYEEIHDYSKEVLLTKDWKFTKMQFYHKTLESILNLINNKNFEILKYKDYFPEKKAKKYFPEEYQLFSQIPLFCGWKLKLK